MLDMTRQLQSMSTITLGTDPELFLAKGGQVIGSEKVLPMEGISMGVPGHPQANGKVVRDGVQVELHPNPSQCRQTLGYEIQFCIKRLQDHLATIPELSILMKGVVDVGKEELDTLSESSRLLGCAPSLNLYDPDATIKVSTTYTKRSAGGHIHLGMPTAHHPYRERMVAMLDILLGNTCVLIDRDPDAAERREVYGRAGEHRLPPHGLEYRTLSNFWMRSYPLMSFVMAQARMAVWTVVMTHCYPLGLKWNPEETLLKMVDLTKVRKAINTNDLDLAKENYQGVKEFLATHCTLSGLNYTNLDDFDYFCEKGLDHWFDTDVIAAWTSKFEVNTGWESFLNYVVRPQRMTALAKQSKAKKEEVACPTL